MYGKYDQVHSFSFSHCINQTQESKVHCDLVAQEVKILDLINNTGAQIYAQMVVAIHKPLPIYSLKSSEWA